MNAFSSTAYTPLMALFATSSPLLLAYFIAIVVAMSYISQYPRAATLTLIAAITMLVTMIVSQVLQINLSTRWRQNHWTMHQYSAIMSGITVVSNVIRAAAFCLMTWAVFAGRSSSPESTGFSANRTPPPIPDQFRAS